MFSVSFLVLFALCSFVSCSHAGPDLTGADPLFESNFIEPKRLLYLYGNVILPGVVIEFDSASRW